MNKRIVTTMRKMRYALVACFIVMSFLGAKQVYAEEWSIREGTLMVENKTFVYDKKQMSTELQDGQGGKVTYDINTNTLTLDNFHSKMVGPSKEVIFAYYMSYDKPLRIVLKGTNSLIVKQEERKNSIIRLDLTEAVIEGSGELIGNTAIQASEKLTIRDCDIRIDGLNSGIHNGGDITLENADVYLTTEEPLLISGALCLIGMDGKGGKLTLDHSNLYAEAKGGNFQSVLLDMDIPEEYYGSPERWSKIPADYIDDYNKHFSMSEDMSVTDKNGNPLNHCAIQWAYNPWFVFSKDGKNLSYVTEDQIARCVIFKSDTKQKQIDAINKAVTAIDAIGTVTLEKEPLIVAARNAYGSLDSLGDKAAYAREKVRNYKKLTDAEATLQQLKEAAGKGGTEENVEDKEIQVNGTNYSIKTPKIKSLKSKKKSSATITYTKDTECSGYQISYSINKKFKKSKTKTKTIKNCKTKKKTVKALKTGKRYYFRVRAFKKIEGKKYYGNWSKVKKAKIK